MNVHFIVTLSESGMKKAEEQGFHEFFKLTGKLNTSNMICFDFENKIKKYNSPEEIIEEFYPIRLAYYQKRKVCILRRFVGVMMPIITIGLLGGRTPNRV